MKDRKWSENQLVTLKKKYANSKKIELVHEIGKSWCAILCKANKLGLKREILEIKNIITIGWSDEEISILKENYFNLNRKELEKKIPRRSWSTIQQKAFVLNLKREVVRNSNFSVLLNETSEIYYWLGFLMADGHFSKYSIQINLGKKDIKHLQKFAKLVNYNKKLIRPSLYINNKQIVDILKEKFKISSNKTYNPCKIINIKDKNLLFSLIIGFVDGDGSIQTDKVKTSLVVKCHSSWFKNLELMLNILCDGNKKTYKTRINKDNLAYFFISDLNILKKIKQKVLKLNLPILKRKWDNIDLNKETVLERGERLKVMCLENFKKGLRPVQVLKENKIGKDFCYKIWNQYNK